MRADRHLPGQWLDPVQNEVVARRHLQAQPGSDDGGGGAADQRRTGDPIARPQRLAGEHGSLEALGRLVGCAGSEDGCGQDRLERCGPILRHGLGLDHLLHGADALDGDGLDHQPPALDDEAVA